MQAGPPFSAGNVQCGLRNTSASFRDKVMGPIMLFFLLKLLGNEDQCLCRSENESTVIQSISIPLENPASLLSVSSTSWILLSLGIQLEEAHWMHVARERIKLHYTLSGLNSTKMQCISFVQPMLHSATASTTRLPEKNESLMCYY